MLSGKLLRPVFPFFADMKDLKICLDPDASRGSCTALHPTHSMLGTQLVVRKSQKRLGHAMVCRSGALAGGWAVLPTCSMQLVLQLPGTTSGVQIAKQCVAQMAQMFIN